MLKLGKYLVITSSLYQLNIAGTTELSDTTQIQKLWKYLVITTSKDTRADIQCWYYTSNEIRKESCHFDTAYNVLIIHFYRRFLHKVRLKKEHILEKKVLNSKENKSFQIYLSIL